MNTLNTLAPADLFTALDLESASIPNRARVERRLSDLRGCFRDTAAYDKALTEGDPLLYAVTAVEAATGDSQLHYGLGVLYPGKIGTEYYLTKGHYHRHRPSAEVYVGLKGDGQMLLEDEASGESRTVPLQTNTVVYVPGHTAHRTVNTGSGPLVYLGIYPSHAGHDYASLAKRNFRMVIVEKSGRPVMELR